LVDQQGKWITDEKWILAGWKGVSIAVNAAGNGVTWRQVASEPNETLQGQMAN
jgi:hypothetical protein